MQIPLRMNRQMANQIQMLTLQLDKKTQSRIFEISSLCDGQIQVK